MRFVRIVVTLVVATAAGVIALAAWPVAILICLFCIAWNMQRKKRRVIVSPPPIVLGPAHSGYQWAYPPKSIRETPSRPKAETEHPPQKTRRSFKDTLFPTYTPKESS